MHIYKYIYAYTNNVYIYIYIYIYIGPLMMMMIASLVMDAFTVRNGLCKQLCHWTAYFAWIQ